jgi:hypothetical protein
MAQIVFHAVVHFCLFGRRILWSSKAAPGLSMVNAQS